MSVKLIVALLCALFSGCANQTPFRIYAPFDKEATLALLKNGSNKISGSGLIRQKGGGVITCAGLKILLIPATNYSADRIKATFGDSTYGYISLHKSPPRFDPDPIEYHQITKETVCDAQGNFEFEGLSDGQFFLISKIYWWVNNNKEGSIIMRRVNAFYGQTNKVVLSPEL